MEETDFPKDRALHPVVGQSARNGEIVKAK